jgi:hypothetical protein
MRRVLEKLAGLLVEVGHMGWAGRRHTGHRVGENIRDAICTKSSYCLQ